MIAIVAVVFCISQEMVCAGRSSGRMVMEGRKSDPDRKGIKVIGIRFSFPSYASSIDKERESQHGF